MYHHWIVYPPSRFMTTVYLDDEPGRTPLTSLAHDGPLYVGMLANLVLLYRLNLLSHPDLGVCLLVYAFVSAFAIWLHQTFHIKGHWIERFLYFHDLRALHLVHHQGTAKHNYGFLDHSCDLIGNSLATADFSLSNSWNQKTDEDKGAETPPAAASVSQLPSLLLPDQLQSPSSPPSPRSQSSPYTAGIMPTLFNNGLLECCYAMTCVAIEIIVGLLGVIFGNARDKENPKALNAPKETGTNSPPHLTPNEDISLKPKKLYGSSSGSGSASPDYEELTADCYPKPITYPEWTKIFLFN